MIYFLTSSIYINESKTINPINSFIDNLKSFSKTFSSMLFVCSNPNNYTKTDKYAKQIYDGFLSCGFNIDSLNVLDGRNEKSAKTLIRNSGIIILAGGNILTQNEFFNRINLSELLKGYDGIIIGISAGSMNSANIVYVQPEIDGETKLPSYKRFINGLGITETMILPHYQNSKNNLLDGMRVFEDIVYSDSVGKKFYAIVDGSYILGYDNTEKAFGEIYLIENAKIKKICSENESVVL